MFKQAFALLVATIGLAGNIGCGGSADLAPVEGKVTLNNKPLADATVLFSPTRGNGPGPFVGTTNTQGEFSLGPVGKPSGGAAADEYMVMITTVKQDPNSPDGAPVDSSQKEVVPAAYRDGSQRYRVPAGGTKEANFEVKGGS